MKIYNHAFAIAFSLETEKSCKSEDDSDYPTGQELRHAILKRLFHLSDDELAEAVGCPIDSFVICQHADGEDCMTCAKCGDCDESLNEDDICSDCLEKL